MFKNKRYWIFPFVGALLVVGTVVFHGFDPDTQKVEKTPDPSNESPANYLYPASVLHYDLIKEETSEFVVGDWPLRYTYIFENPDSDYAKATLELTGLAAKNGNVMSVNFRPAEMDGQTALIMVGAGCVSVQAPDSFATYHDAVLAAGRILDEEKIMAIAKPLVSDEGAFRQCLQDNGNKKIVVSEIDFENFNFNDSLRSNFVKGKSRDDLLDFCINQDESAGYGDAVSCVMELVGRVKEWGSVEAHIEANMGLIQASFAGRENVDSGDSLYSAYANHGISIQAVSNTGGSRPYLRLKTLSRRDEIKTWVSENNLYAMSSTPKNIAKVDLLDGSLEYITLSEPLTMGEPEHVVSVFAKGERTVFLVCAGEWGYDYCNLKIADKEGRIIRNVPVNTPFVLYQVMEIAGWDMAGDIMTFWSFAGDGGIAVGGEYSFGLNSGLMKTVGEYRHEAGACDEDGLNCVGELQQMNYLYEEWLQTVRSRRLKNIGCPEDTLIEESDQYPVACLR